MKKAFALILAMVMVLSLFAACSGPSDTDAKTHQESVAPETEEEQTTEDATTNIPEGFTLGEYSGQTYENTFIKVGCRLPADWTYRTEAELKGMLSIPEGVAGDDLLDAYAKTTVFYVMMASSNSVENCNITMEKVAADTLEALDLKENNERILPMMAQALEAAGATGLSLELGTVMLDGVTFDCIDSRLTLNGVNMVQCCIPMKCDGYLVSLTLTASNEENMEELLDYFYLLK